MRLAFQLCVCHSLVNVIFLAAHNVAFPPLAEDLFEMFDLNDIAAEYARVLPNGEKNAIRKTYKGHIKRLAVNGHFDAVKVDANGPDTLLGMMSVPEEEWNIHFVRNKEIDRGFSTETRAKLPKAMGMSKGLIPKQVWDSSVLGELSPLNTAKADKQTASAKPATPGTPNPMATPNATGVGATSRPKPQQGLVQEATRPKRSTKRSYRDSSFEGYGEGFLDDDQGGETGYSTGEADNAGATVKRRKKVLTGDSPAVSPTEYPDSLLTRLQNPGGGNSASQQYSSMRQAYGPGMVGA
jgi:hypothetical protein